MLRGCLLAPRGCLLAPRLGLAQGMLIIPKLFQGMLLGASYPFRGCLLAPRLGVGPRDAYYPQAVPMQGMGLGLYLGAFLSLQGMMINPFLNTMQVMGANPEGGA